jgi:uncharacterized membrane protein
MKKNIMIVGVVGIVAILSISGYYVLFMKGYDSNHNTTPVISPNQNQTEVRIPVSDISSTATFYFYDSNDVSIRYFAVKDSQGNMHVAFDACDVCYEAKKGYKQINDVMHCINCGREFPISSIGTENIAGGYIDGGCWPSYLPMTIDGDNAVIQIIDLVKKQYMF